MTKDQEKIAKDKAMREKIREYTLNPKNRGRMTDYSFTRREHCKDCGHRVDLFVKLNDENIAEEVTYDGVGCAWSQASASMLTEIIKGKSKEEIEKISDDDFLEMLGGAPTGCKRNCVLLGLDAMRNGLNNTSK